jgi:hypothetical protein
MRGCDLTAGSRDLLPAACRGCTWWQSTSERAAGAHDRPTWERAVQSEAGCFGRALVDEGAVLGVIHVAPGHLVPRARDLPAGPISVDASLLTCAYFYDEEYLAGFQQLLLEVQAALKSRHVEALEAFALLRVPAADRFRAYVRERNLFNHETIEGGGFRLLRRCGGVGLYRLELETLVVVPRWSRLLERLEQPAAAQPV